MKVYRITTYLLQNMKGERKDAIVLELINPIVNEIISDKDLKDDHAFFNKISLGFLVRKYYIKILKLRDDENIEEKLVKENSDNYIFFKHCEPDSIKYDCISFLYLFSYNQYNSLCEKYNFYNACKLDYIDCVSNIIGRFKDYENLKIEMKYIDDKDGIFIKIISESNDDITIFDMEKRLFIIAITEFLTNLVDKLVEK